MQEGPGGSDKPLDRVSLASIKSQPVTSREVERRLRVFGNRLSWLEPPIAFLLLVSSGTTPPVRTEMREAEAWQEEAMTW